MIDLVQSLIDGLGRGSIYALLTLGIAVIFGVMHMVNFAHGELVTVAACVAFAVVVTAEWGWRIAARLTFLGAVSTSVAIEFIAFRRVRGSSEMRTGQARPTTGLSPSLKVILAAIIGRDQDLAFITGVCDPIYGLDQGRVIAAGTPAEIHADPQVQAAYLGAAAPAAAG